MTDGLTASDVALLTGNNGRNNEGMFGGDWGAWIILFLLFGMFNGRGFGGFGGGNGGCEPCATKSDLTAQGIVQKLDGITYGISDTAFALNNTITNGFHGVDNAICNLGYNVQSGFNTLGHQLADCCCQTQRAIDGVNYNLATQACDTRNLIQTTTRDITDNANANTRAILDFLVNDKISTLQAENTALKFQASQTAQNAFITANQDAQTAELIRRLGADCPVPAYVVQPPTQVTFPTNCCGQFAGFNNGCGTF